MINITV